MMNSKTGREIAESLFGKIEGKSFNPNKAKAEWIAIKDLSSPLDKALLLLLDLWRIPNGNEEIDTKNNEIMKHLMDLKEELGLQEFKESDARKIQEGAI